MKPFFIAFYIFCASSLTHAQSIESLIHVASTDGGALGTVASRNSEYFLGFSSSGNVSIGAESYTDLNNAALLVLKN